MPVSLRKENAISFEFDLPAIAVFEKLKKSVMCKKHAPTDSVVAQIHANFQTWLTRPHISHAKTILHLLNFYAMLRVK